MGPDGRDLRFVEQTHGGDHRPVSGYDTIAVADETLACTAMQPVPMFDKKTPQKEGAGSTAESSVSRSA